MLDRNINDRLATLIFDRPPVNAINDAFLYHFESALEAVLRANRALAKVRGSGRHFAADGNAPQMIGTLDKNNFSKLNCFPRHVQNTYSDGKQLPTPTVAVLTVKSQEVISILGVASDLRISGGSARMGFPEVRIG